MSHEVNRLLDEALSVYAVTPERPGLEERVLARVNEGGRQPRTWLAYASAVAAATAALLVLGPLRITEKPAPVPNVGELVRNFTVAPNTKQPVLLATAMSSKRPIRRRQADPKRPEFPTSSPLTAEERTLLEVAQSEPAQLAALNRPIELVEIPLIEIEPLVKEKN